LADGLTQIDWAQPWLAPFAQAGRSVAAHIDAGLQSHEALNAHGGAPVQFVPQSALPTGAAYESYIFNSKQCPTRQGNHDFFNGLCWIHFPQVKTRLNALQARQIETMGVGQVRGSLRDALTLFDENAAFLRAPDALWDALVAKDWRTLFVTQRALWGQAHLLVFGHALLEKLVFPRKAMVAHVYRSFHATDSIVSADAWVAADLGLDAAVSKLARKPFAPLPVLGVPGWWADNEDPQFYADANVFRPPKPANLMRIPAPVA
jgi:hypothetical protein